MLHDYLYRIKTYYRFTKDELKDIAICIILVSIIIGFRPPEPAAAVWVVNFLLTVIIVTLAYFVHESMKRITALKFGYKVTFRPYWTGLFISLILMLITRGRAWFFLPAGFTVDIIQRLRLGKFRYGIGTWQLGQIALYGALGNLAVAFTLKVLSYLPFIGESPVLKTMMLVNVLFAVYSLLPIPYTDGANLFISSRLHYVYMFTVVLSAGIFIMLTGILVTIFAAFLLSGITAIMFFLLYERGSWPPPVE